MPEDALKGLAEKFHLTVKVSMNGIVERFNYGPKGNIDSLLIKCDGKLVQANFPPQVGAKVKKAVTVGDEVSITGVPEERKGDHPVYKIEKLTVKGKEMTFPEPTPPSKEKCSLEGVVKYLNFARHGEVDGVVLESGDYIHLGPHAAQDLKVAVGQTIKAEGMATTLPGGRKVMEQPERVNGVELPHGPPHKKGHGEKKPPMKHGPEDDN